MSVRWLTGAWRLNEATTLDGAASAHPIGRGLGVQLGVLLGTGRNSRHLQGQDGCLSESGLIAVILQAMHSEPQPQTGQSLSTEDRVVRLCAVSERVTCSSIERPRYDGGSSLLRCHAILQETLELSRTSKVWSVVCAGRLELRRLRLLENDCESDRHCRAYIRQSCPPYRTRPRICQVSRKWTCVGAIISVRCDLDVS